MTQLLLDTTVLIAVLREFEAVRAAVASLRSRGHVLGTSCVNVAELERGLLPQERKRTATVIERLRFFETTREAARRAGAYQREFGRRGVSIELADALVAGTARVHGASVITDNVRDFPMRDVRALKPEEAERLL